MSDGGVTGRYQRWLTERDRELTTARETIARMELERDEWEEARENYRGSIGKLTAEVGALTARLEAAEGTLSLVEPEFLSLDAFEAFAAWRALAGAETAPSHTSGEQIPWPLMLCGHYADRTEGLNANRPVCSACFRGEGAWSRTHAEELYGLSQALAGAETEVRGE